VFLARALILLLALLIPGLSARAQGRPEIEIRVGPGAYPPQIAVRNVLAEEPFDTLLKSGFPARLTVRAETWSIGRWFDDQQSSSEWSVIVRYSVVDRAYEVARVVGSRVTPLGSYVRFADARAASELAYQPALPPPPRGRKSYVLVQAELQTLDVSDLDELERWLNGEARPLVRGRRNPGTVLTRGLRSLASRILGGEVRRLEARSPAMELSDAR
jgi:hypothetical protein